MRSVTTAAALGAGTEDGEDGWLGLGDYGVPLAWYLGGSLWRSPPREVVRLHSVPMQHSGPGGVWKYLYNPKGNPGSFDRSDFGFEPSPLRNAGEIMDAGLILQERMLGVVTCVDGAGQGQIATVYYPFNLAGDGIAGTIAPEDYISVSMNASAHVGAFAYQKTAWADSALTSAKIGGKPILAPHLYTKTFGASNDCSVWTLHVLRRWVYRPGGP